MCAKYGWEKPNDRRALDLMNAAAKAVMTEISDIIVGYGVSDEYRYYYYCSSKRSILTDKHPQLRIPQDLHLLRQKREVSLYTSFD